MLIGSRALAFWDNTFKVREDADWDVVMFPHERHYIQGKVEYHDPNFLNNSKIQELFGSGSYFHGVEVCSPEGLLLIKRSHLWRDYQFDKHITQYHKHLRPMCSYSTFSVEQQVFLSERIEQTKKEFPQGNPNLNQTNEEFFDDAVTKVYDHDYLHELYAFYDEPMWAKLKYATKKDKAWCEKDLWDILDIWDQHKCVAEECYVIATERFLVPSNWEYPSKLAYMKALRKVCTTLCSGWFRDHAIGYYPKILELYDPKKFEDVQMGLTLDILQPKGEKK